jgi:hypothetical protein
MLLLLMLWASPAFCAALAAQAVPTICAALAFGAALWV